MDLTYEEVDTLQSQTIQLEENVAYGPVKQSQKIELKENIACGPVKWNLMIPSIENEINDTHYWRDCTVLMKEKWCE